MCLARCLSSEPLPCRSACLSGCGGLVQGDVGAWFRAAFTGMRGLVFPQLGCPLVDYMSITTKLSIMVLSSADCVGLA